MSGLSSSRQYYGVSYGDGRFVCVGNNGDSYYSTDGVNWVSMSGLAYYKVFYGVAYGMNRFVAVGDEGVNYYSTNGTTWSSMSGNYGGYGRGVAYGNGKFVRVTKSGGILQYSTDGTTWVDVGELSSSTDMNSITHTEWKNY